MRELTVVMLMVAGCGTPMTADGGVTRMAFVKTQDARYSARGFELADRPNTEVAFWSDAGVSFALTEDAEGFQVFEVPEGPALFEFAPKRFVYSRKERLLPCGPGLIGGFAAPDAGIALDLTLSQPATGEDSLEVMSALLRWQPERLVELDAGTGTVNQTVSWRGRAPLTGPVTVLHRAQVAPIAEFVRFTTVGILDAGILDAFAEAPVLSGTFEPVASAGERPVSWDGDSLDTLQHNARVWFTRLQLLRGGLPIAGLRTTALPRTASISMEVPALEPEALRVEGLVLAPLDTGRPWAAAYGWQAPLNGGLEMKLRLQPPTGADISPDGSLMGWFAPPIAPSLYLVKLLLPEDAPGILVAEVLATFVTDETIVPIPAHLRRPHMMVEVTAVWGSGLSAASCAFHSERLPAWTHLPAVSREWLP